MSNEWPQAPQEKPKGAPEKEKIDNSILFDLYRHADDAGKSQDLEDIKQTADEISLELFKLGVTDSPVESKLGEAYVSASKVKNHYTDIEQAQSAMKRIALLISESDGFENASEKWEQNKE